MSSKNENIAPSVGGKTKGSRARTPKGKENYLINLAMGLVEEQLLNGTASSQVLTHFLKLATTKEKLENEKLRSDLRVAEAKIKSFQSADEIKDLYEKALSAMNRYSGEGDRLDEY